MPRGLCQSTWSGWTVGNYSCDPLWSVFTWISRAQQSHDLARYHHKVWAAPWKGMSHGLARETSLAWMVWQSSIWGQNVSHAGANVITHWSILLFSFLYFYFSCTRNGSQGLTHARHVLYHSATSRAQRHIVWILNSMCWQDGQVARIISHTLPDRLLVMQWIS